MTPKVLKPNYTNEPIIIEGETSEQMDGLCIFAHHNPLGIITPIHHHHISELANSGMNIWVVSSGQLIDAEVDKIKNITSKIIIRKSIGRDFGSYAQAFSLISNLSKYKFIIFINDSVYGPFQSINEIVKTGESKDCDIFGLTDSWDKAYHLQGYFLMVKNNCLRSGFLNDFFQTMKKTNDKQYVIDNFEIGFSVRAILSNFRLSALCNSKDVIEFTNNRLNSLETIRPGRTLNYIDSLAESDINITHFCWKDLIESFGMPYIKRELLTINPSKIPDVYSWKKIISKISPLLVDKIEEDMKLFTAITWKPPKIKNTKNSSNKRIAKL